LYEVDGGVVGVYEQEAPSVLKGLATKRQPDASVKALHELLSEFNDSDDVMVERGRHCAATLTRSLTGLSVLPDGHADFAATLAKHATVCASARSGGHGKARWTFVYRARNQEGIEAIKQALSLRTAQLKVESAFPEHLAADEKKHAAALHAARKRALIDAKLEAKGSELRVTHQVEASAAERGDMAAFDARRKARAEAAARVVRSMAAGEAPAADDINKASSKAQASKL
jgi:hypothetical protein